MKSSFVSRVLSPLIAVMCLLFGAPSQAAGPANADLVARGAYLANAGDCLACHTKPGGKPFAGGLAIDTPFGAVSSPNITPDRATGIGAWTDDEFYRVMHEGIGRHGEYLYPVMPFPWYTRVSREDVLAIKAYLFTQPAVNQARAPNTLMFPVSIRESMLAWREVFFKPQTFQPDSTHSDQVNRGDYLVNGLAHCGECHNARPVAGMSKWRQPFAGGVIDNWYAPNISSDVHDGIGAWSEADIANYLKTGAAPGKGIALGPMAEAVHSLSHLSQPDLLAIAAYLKTTPPKAEKDQKLALFKGHDARGGDTYLNYCASCHGVNGKGVPGVIPALDGNGAVTAQGPQNVIRVVLGGLQAQQNYAPMIAIGAAMSDDEVADVTNYVRQTWGNAAPATAMPGMVEALRKETDTAMTAAPLSACPKIDSPAVAKAIADARTGIASELGTMTDDSMPDGASKMVAKLRAVSPQARTADVVNGLTSSYCSVVRGDAKLDWNQKALKVGHFSQLVYMAANTKNPVR